MSASATLSRVRLFIHPFIHSGCSIPLYSQASMKEHPYSSENKVTTWETQLKPKSKALMDNEGIFY